jgi:HAD superfamily hydrolase (TIGR01549 family)
VAERTWRTLQRLDRSVEGLELLAAELSELGTEVEVIPVAGVREALEHTAGHHNVLVSNTRWTSGATLRKVLASELLVSRFAGFAFSDEVGVAKPNPEIFRLAWSGQDVRPSQTVHIGDRGKRDVQGAKAYGARAVVCRVFRRRREQGDCEADGLLYDYAGLPALLSLLAGDEVPTGWEVAGEGLPVWGPPVVGRAVNVREPVQGGEPGRVILLKNSAPEFVPMFRDAAGVLARSGGYGSHAAQTAPLCDTPCIVGLDQLARPVNDGALVLLDGSRGRVLVEATRA